MEMPPAPPPQGKVSKFGRKFRKKEKCEVLRGEGMCPTALFFKTPPPFIPTLRKTVFSPQFVGDGPPPKCIFEMTGIFITNLLPIFPLFQILFRGPPPSLASAFFRI